MDVSGLIDAYFYDVTRRSPRKSRGLWLPRDADVGLPGHRAMLAV